MFGPRSALSNWMHSRAASVTGMLSADYTTVTQRSHIASSNSTSMQCSHSQLMIGTRHFSISYLYQHIITIIVLSRQLALQ